MFSKKKPELVENKAVVGKVSGSSVQKLTAPFKNLSKKQKVTSGIVLLLIIIIGAGIMYSVIHSRNVAKANTQKAYETAMNTANKLHSDGQDAYAKKALDDLMAKYSKDLSPEQIRQIHTTMASIQYGLGDTQAAVEQRKIVIDSIKNPGFMDYYNVAHACDTANDKACAVKYYTLANKSLEDPNNRPPDAAFYSNYITYRLKALGGQ